MSKMEKEELDNRDKERLGGRFIGQKRFSTYMSSRETEEWLMP